MPYHIRTLADEMRAGRWHPETIAPIQLARGGGWVLDGRHRLNAVIETKRPQWFYVAHDVDPDTFDVIDAGATRTPANVLEADGLKNGRALESVARLMHSWLVGAAEFSGKPSRSRVLELARTHNEALQPLFPIAERASKQTIVKVSGGRTTNPMPKSIAAFCAFLEGGTGGLIGRLADWPEEEIYNHPADAVALLRTALVKRATGGRAVSKRASMSLFVMAKNLDHTGAPFPPKGLVYRSAQAFPTPEWPVTLPWGLQEDDSE
jgi:hypothetical protein